MALGRHGPCSIDVADVRRRARAAGSTGNGTAGSGFPQYTYRADADKGCRGDTVVWGSSAHKGVYYVDGVGPQRIGGFYACMSAVKKAGYQVVTS